MPIRNRLAELHPEITAWRRDFHEHPELLFDVQRTAGLVAERLRAFGADKVVTGVGRTGGGIVTATARAHGCAAHLDYQRGYPVTMNHPDQTRFAADCAEEVAGPGRLDRDIAPIMPAEDFAFMLEARPGAYIFLGNGDSAGCHHSAYDFDDEAIPFGCSWFATLAERGMPLQQE